MRRDLPPAPSDDGSVEGFGDVAEAGEAGGAVRGRFVALDLLFGHWLHDLIDAATNVTA